MVAKQKTEQPASSTSSRGRTVQPHKLPKQKVQIQKRPRIKEERLASLLEAAADVFLEQGFDRAKLDEIARRANASKTTLYQRFPTKEALFSAVLELRLSRVAAEINMDDLPADAPVQQGLLQFGQRLLTYVLSDDMVGLTRTISTVAPQFPSLGQKLLDLGVTSDTLTLTRFLQAKISRGELLSTEPVDVMARQFILVALDGLLFSKLLGRSEKQSTKTKQIQIERAIRMFLRCYARP